MIDDTINELKNINLNKIKKYKFITNKNGKEWNEF